MNKVVIAGGSGFLGQHIGEHLSAAGYEVVVLSRSGSGGKFKGVKWDGKSVGEWAKELEGAKAVINLSGASIEKKWTDSYKKVLYSSRLDPTTAVGQAIAQCENPPEVWVNASAIGFYGDTGDRSVSESSQPGDGFMPELCVAWEKAVQEIETPKTRNVITRFGVVLGPDDGAFPLLKKITTFGLGGPVGSGEQYISWVHVDDVCGIVHWAVDSEVAGIVNVVSPQPKTNADFMEAMRAEIGRPPVPAAPAFLMKAVGGLIGIEAGVLLQGQRVYPVIAEGQGYSFLYPTLGSALGDLLSSESPSYA